MRRGQITESVVPFSASGGGGGGTPPPISEDISYATYAKRGSSAPGSVEYFVAVAAGGYSIGNVAPVVDTLYAFPFVIGTVRTADQMSNELAVSGGAGSQFRFGFYRNTSYTLLYPTSLIVDSGVRDGTVVGFHAVPINITFQPGLYWGAFICGTGAPIMRDANKPVPHLGIVAGGVLNRGIGFALAFSALPGSFPAGASLIGSGIVPTSHRLRYSA